MSEHLVDQEVLQGLFQSKGVVHHSGTFSTRLHTCTGILCPCIQSHATLARTGLTLNLVVCVETDSLRDGICGA